MFNIPVKESKVVGRLFAYSLTVASSYVVARTVGDSLFLSRVGNDQLGLVFVLAGCFTAVAAGGWYFATRHLSISKTMQASGLTFAVLSLSAWALLPKYHHSFWLMAAIYLLAEVKGCINAINIISGLNTKLGREASKSAWAQIGLAAPIAAVVAGGAFAVESNQLSFRTWLLVAVALDLISFVIGFLVGKTQKIENKRTQTNVSSAGRRGQAKSLKVYVCSNKFRFWIGVLIAAKVIALTIVSFEWKTSVNTFFEGDPENLLRYFGIYYVAVGATTIALQIFVTKTLLVRRNLSLPILLMPIVLMGVAISVFVGTGIVVVVGATLGKSLEVWRRSVHDTTLNRLYTRIRRENRRLTISLNSGLVKPMSEVMASSVIFLGAAVIYRSFFVAALFVWIIAAVRLIRLVKSPKLSERHHAVQSNPDSEEWKAKQFQTTR